MNTNELPASPSRWAARRPGGFANWPIRLKLSVAAAGIALITAATLTAVSLLSTRSALTQMIGRNLEIRAVAEGERLGDALAEQINIVRSLTLNPVILTYLVEQNAHYSQDKEASLRQLRQVDARWQTWRDDDLRVLALDRTPPTSELAKFQVKFSGIERIMVTDRYGAVVGAIGGRPAHFYVGDEDWWLATWNEGLGDVYISQPFVYQIAINRVPAIIVASSIVDPASGRFDGAVYVLARFEPLANLVENIQLGTTGHASVVNQGLTVIADSDPQFRDQPFDATLQPVIQAMQSAWISQRFRGRQAVLGLAQVRTRARQPAVSKLGWMIVVHQDQSEALRPTFNATLSGLIALLVIIAIMVPTTIYAAGRLTQPIKQMADAAQHIRDGNLDVSVPAQSEDEIGLLAHTFNTMAQQLRDLIHNLETHVQERAAEAMERSRQLEAMFEIGRVASSTMNPDELLQKAVDAICEHFGYYHAGVLLLDAGARYVELHAGSGETGRKLAEEKLRLEVGGHSMVGWTAAQRRARISQKASQDEIRADHPLLPDTRSEITLPLMVSHRLLGVLDVQSTHENAFNEQDVTTLQSMADQLAMALQNAHLFQETQNTLGRAEILYEASRRLTTASTTTEVANAIIDCVAETEVDGCMVILFDFSPEGRPETMLYLGNWRRDRTPLFQPGLRLPISQSAFPMDMIGTLWTLTDVDADTSLPASVQAVFKESGVKAVVNIPLNTKDKVIGQVVVIRSTPGAFSDMAQRLYEMLSAQAAIALERAQLLERAQRRVEREQIINEVANRVRAGFTLEQVLDTTAREITQVMGAARVAIRLHMPGEET